MTEIFEKLSPLQELFEDLIKTHGTEIYDCIIAHCLTVDKKEISISDDCIKAIIGMIEKAKLIKLEEEKKQELHLLKLIELEKQLIIWLAMCIGIDQDKAESMSLLQVLNTKKIFVENDIFSNNEDVNFSMRR